MEIMSDCSFVNVPTSLNDVVYHLWQQRNALLHSNNPRMEEAILAQVRWEVRMRIMAKGHFKRLNKQKVLVAK
jgi:hypothetical protein